MTLGNKILYTSLTTIFIGSIYYFASTRPLEVVKRQRVFFLDDDRKQNKVIRYPILKKLLSLKKKMHWIMNLIIPLK
jgi:hypothetical protein